MPDVAVVTDTTHYLPPTLVAERVEILDPRRRPHQGAHAVAARDEQARHV